MRMTFVAGTQCGGDQNGRKLNFYPQPVGSLVLSGQPLLWKTCHTAGHGRPKGFTTLEQTAAQRGGDVFSTSVRSTRVHEVAAAAGVYVCLLGTNHDGMITS